MAFFGRGENKYKNPYTIQHSYKDYNIDKEGPYLVPYSVYAGIVSDFLLYLSDRVLEGLKVRLPAKLGVIQIIKKKMNYKSQMEFRRGVNWKATVEAGKTVYHHNSHSNGYKYLFFWDKFVYNKVKNLEKYRFIPTRTMKREMARLVIEEKKDYFESSYKK